MFQNLKLFANCFSVFFAICVSSFAFAGVAHAEEAPRLVFEVEADRPVIRAGETQSVVLRALVRPAEVRREVRAPLAVAIVLDKSGSMGSAGKMENAKLGAIEALEKLDARDIATVVVYDGEARVLIPPTPTSDLAIFRRAIAGIHPGGSTALYAGTQLGAQQLTSFINEGYVPRVVMLSDGMANVGPSSASALAQLGREMSRREMTVTTIGLGLDYNEDLMTALAAESGGNSYFAKDAAALPGIFEHDMDDATALTARQVRVRVICEERVTPIRSIGRAGTAKARTIETSIDNLYGSEKYALFEIEIPKSTPGAEVTVAHVELEYVDAMSGAQIKRMLPLKLSASTDAEEATRRVNAEIVSQVEIAKNAEIRDEVVRLADEGRAKEASSLLKKRTQDLKSLAPEVAAAAPAIAAEAEYFDSLATDLEEQGAMSNEARKENVNKSYVEKSQQSKENNKEKK